MAAKSDIARKGFGDFMPKFAELTDDVIYDDIWERPGLSKRDRSFMTMTALIALNRPNELTYHMGLALGNGVTKDEIKEMITHLAFYCGWPSSVTAMLIAMEVLKDK